MLLRYDPSDFAEHIQPELLRDNEAPPAAPMRDENPDDVVAAIGCLQYLSQERCDNYDSWLRVGMALHSVGDCLFEAWDQWSGRSPSYDPNSCRSKWASFGNGVGAVQLGTLVKWAREDSGKSSEQITGRDDESFGRAANGEKPAHKAKTQPAASATKVVEAPAASKPSAPAARQSPASARRIISNVRDSSAKIEGSEDFTPVRYYKNQPAIAQDIHDCTGGWPKSAGGMLFFVKPTTDELPDDTCIHWLTSSDKLFGWMGGICDMRWAGGDALHESLKQKLTPSTKKEFYEFLGDNSRDTYKSVELLPHHPPTEETYYVPCHLPSIVGKETTALRELVAALNPETELDRQLMLAALITPGWGGSPGTRPAFVFTSDHGRGVGKSVTADTFASVWGGAISVGAKEDADQIRKRLLSDDSLSKRLIVIDNLKGRLSDGNIEGMITARVLDGWKPYHGQASRPNTLTWYMTANTPSISRDLADRSVVIKVGRTKHGKNFTSWAIDHIRANRGEIIAEIISILKDSPLCTIAAENRDRWGSWQDAILTRFEDGNEMAKLYRSRRSDVDADSEDAEEIAACVIGLVKDHIIDYEHKAVLFSRQMLYNRLLKDGVIDKQFSPRAVTTWVRDRCSGGPLACLSERRTMYARMWLFTGEHASYTSLEHPDTIQETP